MQWYVSTEKLLSSLSTIELEYEPNSYPHYSNLGMQLLGVALERASGESFIKYIESRILKTLGMKNSYFVLDPNKRMGDAFGYVFIPVDWEKYNSATIFGFDSRRHDIHTRFCHCHYHE